MCGFFIHHVAYDSLHLLVQIGFSEDTESLRKVKLSNVIEKRFGEKIRMVKYNNNKIDLAVVGILREEHADCPLPETIVREEKRDEGNMQWMLFRNSNEHWR
jgi:hypothetical protein